MISEKEAQEQVDRYIKIHGKLKVLKEEENELRETLIPYLKKHDCPDGGPHLLEYTKVPRTNFSWEHFARHAARQAWGKEATRFIKAAIKRAGKTEIDKLSPKINPSWKKG